MTPPSSPSSHVMIVTGEPSGEKLGAELGLALRTLHPSLFLSGVGGEAMKQAGIKSLIPLSQVAVMGITEVIPKLFDIHQAIETVVRYAKNNTPDVLVVIDSLDFTHAVARKIKKYCPHTRIVRYVAPKLRAWRPSRVKKLQGIYDAILVLFPFEVKFFSQFGLKTTFVGHPVVNRLHTPSAFPSEKEICLLLPGSRNSEIKQLLPIFLETAREIQKSFPHLSFVLPTVSHMLPLVESFSPQKILPSLHIITDETQRFEAMRQGKVALAASGTVSLELMAAGVPTVIAYKVSQFSAWLARRLICVKKSLHLQKDYVTLLNIILNEEIMPEFLQEECTASHLSHQIFEILKNPIAQQKQKDAFEKGLSLLGAGGPPPAMRAASEIISFL